MSQTFRDFEAEGWARITTAYADFFSAITGRAIEPLLDAAGIGEGMRVLDVATGPGHVAGRAAARGAIVTGVDLSEAMVAFAGSQHPTVTFCTAAAEDLPFADGFFDAALSSFGIGHFGDPERAVVELCRVVAKASNVALAWWDAPERARLLGVFHEALLRVGAPQPAEVPSGSPFFRFSSEPALRALLGDCGLLNPRVRRVSFVHRISSADALWTGVLSSTVRTAAAVLRQPQSIQEQVRAAFFELVGPYQGADGLDMPVSIQIAVGQTPH